ncbi:MAG TPA: TM2 domain-containing protein [Allosphingosinicella sp.]|nr:TM2 domain-containing protein [Allosphingosinicella sp.]
MSGFGRKGAGPQPLVGSAAEIAAKRAAFLAEERARPRPEPGRDPKFSGVTPGYNPYIREKSLGSAYLLWFFLGGIGGHRFYLGFQISAALQASLMPVSYGLMFGGSLMGFYTMCAAGLWLLADIALMPGMLQQANERIRNRAVGAVFA